MPLTLALLHFSLGRGDSRDNQATADMLCCARAAATTPAPPSARPACLYATQRREVSLHWLALLLAQQVPLPYHA